MTNTLYEEIKNCISIVDDEISLHKKNEEVNGDIETLYKIKQQLINMGKFMSPDRYMPTYNYILRDSLWDYLRIAEPLFKVYHKYIKL